MVMGTDSLLRSHEFLSSLDNLINVASLWLSVLKTQKLFLLEHAIFMSFLRLTARVRWIIIHLCKKCTKLSIDKMSAVRIQSSANSYKEYLLTVKCIERMKIKKKRPGMAHLLD